MGTPYLSEIRIMSFNFAPKGWAQCNGQLMPINQNQALFALLGTQFGGNGQTNFALPDLRGRVPMHMGAGFTIGQAGGEFAHALTQSEMPTHIHLATAANDAANSPSPSNTLLAQTDNTTFGNAYAGGDANLAPMAPGVIASTGGGQPHPNMAPYLTLNFCIALQGVFPSHN